MPIPATAAIDALVRWIDQCRAGDPDAAHGLRVATRRLDVWLRLGGRRILRDDLRWLRAIAGPARDLDVRLADPGAATTDRDALRARRAAAHATLVAALDTPRAAGLAAALPLLPPIDPAAARPHLARLARAALALPDHDAEALHVVRRAIRRVRYGLDWLGEPHGPLAKAQDALGTISDRLAAGRVPIDQGDADVRAARAAIGGARGFLETWSDRWN